MNRKRSLLIILILFTSLFPLIPIPTVRASELVVSISHSYDDVWMTEAGNIFSNTFMVMILDNEIGIHSFLRFQDLEISKTAKINYATLKIYVAETQETPDPGSSVTIYGIDEPDCAPFTSDGSLWSLSRPYTSASVNWNTTVWAGYQSVNVTDIVKEIINQYAWEFGNDLGLQILGGSDSGQSPRSFEDYYHAYHEGQAQLTIVYDIIDEEEEPPGDPDFIEQYGEYTIWRLNATDWIYSKAFTVNGSTEGNLTNYQVEIEILRKEGADYSNRVHVGENCQGDFDDIRFRKSDRVTDLDYWMEYSTNTAYWEKYGENPILDFESGEGRTSFVSVLEVSGTYHMYYSYRIGGVGGVKVIGHATSPDGLDWTKDGANNPVLNGTPASWDADHVNVPMVWIEGSTWYMLYTGINGATQSIGLATSNNGTTWIKEGTNPVMTAEGGWEASQIENWGIMKIGSTYYLWYNSMGAFREIGLATSTDLTSWNKDGANPIFTNHRFCAFPFKYGSYYYLLVPHYTDGLDYSEIELYRDTNPTFYDGERTFVGVAFGCSETGWDSTDQDTPFILTDDVGRDTYSVTDGDLWCYYSGTGVIPTVSWRTGIIIETDATEALTLPSYYSANFWVEMGTIPSSPDNKTIYVYYGNAIAESNSSGYHTFIVFDDFNGASLNATKWNVTQGAVDVDGSGNLELLGTVGDLGIIESYTTYPINASIHSRAKSNTDDPDQVYLAGARDPGSWDDRIALSYSNVSAIFYTFKAGAPSRTWFNIGDLEEWYDYEVQWTNFTPMGRALKSDELLVNHTTTVPVISLASVFREGNENGENVLVNYTFVRNFRFSEPSSIGWGNESEGIETWYVTDENDTVVWTGENGYDVDDIEDIIDDLLDPGGGDPLDPTPGTQGWDTEGPFTRFKMRLYILFMGLGCLFTPLWAMAYKKLDAPGYAGCFIVMVMGVGLLWSITGI